MADQPVRTSVPLREVQPGKFFESVARPPLTIAALPYRIEFGHVHVVDARGAQHHANPHQHPHYECILVEAGEYRCLVNETPVSAGPGGVILLKPGDWHCDQCPGPVAFLALSIKVGPGPIPGNSANLLRADLPSSHQHLAQTDGSLHALAQRMLTEGRHGDGFSGPLLDSLAQEFVWRLLRLLPREHLDQQLIRGMDLHGFSAALMALFEQHLTSTLPPLTMATALGLSERTLTTRCRTAFGEAPGKLFTRFRLERARTLLVQTDLSIKAVAECLGFENPYHFSTVYKRVHGVAPTHHRPG
jgi:AraC-like DNA-binding protein